MPKLYVVETTVQHLVYASSENEAEDIALANLEEESHRSETSVHELSDDPLRDEIVNEWYGALPYDNGQNHLELTVEQLVEL
jgi:hypothetical protein